MPKTLTTVQKKQQVSVTNIFLVSTLAVSTSVILGSFFAAGIISTKAIQQKQAKVEETNSSSEKKATSTSSSIASWNPEEIKIMDKNKVVVKAFDFEGDDVLSKDIVVKNSENSTLFKSDVDKLYDGVSGLIKYYNLILKYNHLFQNQAFIDAFNKMAGRIGASEAIDEIGGIIGGGMTGGIEGEMTDIGGGVVVNFNGKTSVGLGTSDGTMVYELWNSEDGWTGTFVDWLTDLLTGNSNSNSNGNGNGNGNGNSNSNSNGNSNIVPCLINCYGLADNIADIVNSMKEHTTAVEIRAFSNEKGEDTFSYQMEEIDSNNIDLTADLKVDKLIEKPISLTNEQIIEREFTQREIDAIIGKMQQRLTEIEKGR